GYVSKLQKWVPHSLTPQQRLQRVTICQNLLDRQAAKPFLQNVITCDEKWVYYKNVARKRGWAKPGQSAGTVARKTLSKEKRLLTVFWDSHGVLMYNLLEPNQTMNSTIYCTLLDKLEKVIRKKRRVQWRGKNIIFLHDNARPHT